MVPVAPFAQKKSDDTKTRQPAKNLALTRPSFRLSSSTLTRQTGQTDPLPATRKSFRFSAIAPRGLGCAASASRVVPSSQL